MLIVWFLSIKSSPNLLFGVLCLPDQSHPVCATDNKPSCALHLLGWFIGSRGFSSLGRRPEFWVLHLTEAEDIKKRWQEYTEGLYKTDLQDPDNHNGGITHLEPDILECEVKWALESITTNKAGGGDGIPAVIFQILKDHPVKVLHSMCQQIWKTQHCPRTGKVQFLFQSPKKAMPKAVQTTTQLLSSHMLAK